MKTTILTTAILVAIVFGISQSALAKSVNKEEASTILTGVSSINKIEVHGNVELYLTSGNADQVKVYNRYYAENALVQDEKGVLRVTSYSAQKLVVWVTASDLRQLEVYDNAEVKSFGKFSAIDINVKLYNNASARLDVNSYSLNMTLSEHAKVDLFGNVDEAYLQYDHSSILNNTNFNASHLVKSVNLKHFCKSEAELAAL